MTRNTLSWPVLTSSPHPHFNSIFLWASAAYLVRIVLATGLYYAFDRREYTDDIKLHLQLATDPLFYFFCRNAFLSQQPPLLGLVETSLLPLTHLMGSFFGPRLSYSAWDVAGSAILIHALRMKQRDAPIIWVLLFLGPLNLYTSVVSAQDESISYCFACICGALILHERHGWAFMLACFATVACKILFLPLALTLIPLVLRKNKLGHLAAGTAVLLTPYFLASQCQYPAGNFALPAPHTINVWQIFIPYSQQNWRVALQASMIAFTIIASLQLAYVAAHPAFKLKSARSTWITLPDPILSYSIVLLAFLGFSYHVVPEYFLLLIPLIVVYLVRLTRAWQPAVACFALVMAIPILPDVLRYFVRHGLGPDWIPAAHQTASLLVSILSLLLSLGLIHLSQIHAGKK